MSLSLYGAVQTADLTSITDDGDAIYAAARSYYGAMSDMAYDSSHASTSWSSLPDVLRADALTPALEPLMRPAQQLADDLLRSAEALVSAASAARDEIADLKRRRARLVTDIEAFHSSAAGKAEAHIRQQAAWGDVGGALVSLAMSWNEVPALVAEEYALRLRASVFNMDVEGTLTDLAKRFDGIDAGSRGTDRLPDIGSPRAVVSLLDEGVAPSAVAALTGESIGALFTGMSEKQVEKALQKNSALDAWAAGLTPAQAAAWWASLSKKQQAGAIAGAPVIIGALNGIPALSRVAANKKNAASQLRAAQSRVQTLEDQMGSYPPPPADQYAQMTNELKIVNHEISFLKSATGPNASVQLYLFDPANSRIVQMIGTPSPATKHVITYVPGTFTSMDSFYTRGSQQIATYLQGHSPDATVAFVYKDGLFPGENDPTGATNLLRIEEANDAVAAAADGSKLAAFQTGLAASDPELGSAAHVAIGHSWGLTDVTSSEVAGAHYNQVISLSGAGMLPQWAPSPHTTYTDFSYYDILQEAQRLPGHPVWAGDVPRMNPAFQHGAYYVNSDAYAGINPIKIEGQLLDNHNLIQSASRANAQVLADLKQQVFER
ncbi:MAG: hypothetical protein FWD85_03275 [Microbacteriaceae bacterium]|nr:hypothetical protein [Microbacteriaceae bacterium]